MIIVFETKKVEDLCRVAENGDFAEIVEDFLSQELNRNVAIRNDKLHITVKGEDDEIDIISEILYTIFAFQDFKCIFLCQLFQLGDIAYTFAKMYQNDIDRHVEINKLAKVFALSVASKYEDIDEILHDSKYEFALKVCEAWKDFVNIKAGITLSDREIERVSAYLQVMMNGFSTIQPIMEKYAIE